MANIELEPITLELDPEWRVCRRYACGHVQHACCVAHLDGCCPVCQPALASIEARLAEREAMADLIVRRTLGDSL